MTTDTNSVPAGRRTLTLITRSYCHLCQEMAAVVGPLADELGFALELVDVDADPALEARYGELVPVLLYGQRTLCHYFADAPRLRAELAALRAEQAAP